MAEARDKARAMRSQIAEGINPIDAKAAMAVVAAKAKAPSRTFEWCAAEHIAAKRPGWKSDKHAAQWESCLVSYAHPVLERGRGGSYHRDGAASPEPYLDSNPPGLFS